MAVKNTFKKATKRVGKAFGFSDVIDQIDKLKNSLDAANNQLAEQNQKINFLSQSMAELVDSNQKILEHSKKVEKENELYFHALFKKANESDKEMQKRFFKGVPKASGDLLLIQQGNTKLFKIFNEICQKNQIPYWADSGTLLGAVRHQGSVPWDDDIDVCMMRDDIHKLEEALKDTDYHITIIYDAVNVSKQLRFRNKNHDIPCFVDVFIFDYGSEDKETTWQDWLTKRKEIVDSAYGSKDPMLKEWQNLIVANHNDNTKLSKYLDKYYEDLYGDIFGDVHTGGPGGVITAKEAHKNPTKFKYIVEGLDNLVPISKPNSPRVFEKNIIFPTKKLAYDGIRISVPNDYEEYLHRLYGDYLKLPEDLISHFRHIDRSALDQKAIQDFLKSNN